MTDLASEAAFADPVTLRAWRRERRRSLTNLFLWILSLLCYGALFTTTADRLGQLLAGVITLPILVVSVVGMGLASLRWEHLSKMKAVLAAYPWQHCPPPGPAHPAGIEYFRLPDPDEPRKNVQVAFRRYGLGKSWRRAVAEARSAGFAFAGDPRYACVVALPGFRRLLAVRPQHVHLDRDGTRPRTVSEAAWRHARQAGITTPPSAQEQRRKLLYLVWRIFRNRPPSSR